MGKTTLNTIKAWFKTGLKPTQTQFWNVFDSFWHKDEKIPTTAIKNFDSLFNEKADSEAFEAHLRDNNTHISNTERQNYNTHLNNTDIHVNQSDKETWNDVAYKLDVESKAKVTHEAFDVTDYIVSIPGEPLRGWGDGEFYFNNHNFGVISDMDDTHPILVSKEPVTIGKDTIIRVQLGLYADNPSGTAFILKAFVGESELQVIDGVDRTSQADSSTINCSFQIPVDLSTFDRLQGVRFEIHIAPTSPAFSIGGNYEIFGTELYVEDFEVYTNDIVSNMQRQLLNVDEFVNMILFKKNLEKQLPKFSNLFINLNNHLSSSNSNRNFNLDTIYYKLSKSFDYSYLKLYAEFKDTTKAFLEIPYVSPVDWEQVKNGFELLPDNWLKIKIDGVKYPNSNVKYLHLSYGYVPRGIGNEVKYVRPLANIYRPYAYCVDIENVHGVYTVNSFVQVFNHLLHQIKQIEPPIYFNIQNTAQLRTSNVQISKHDTFRGYKTDHGNIAPALNKNADMIFGGLSFLNYWEEENTYDDGVLYVSPLGSNNDNVITNKAGENKGFYEGMVLFSAGEENDLPSQWDSSAGDTVEFYEPTGNQTYLNAKYTTQFLQTWQWENEGSSNQSPATSLVAAKLKLIRNVTKRSWQTIRLACWITAMDESDNLRNGLWDRNRGYGIINVAGALKWLNDNLEINMNSIKEAKEYMNNLEL